MEWPNGFVVIVLFNVVSELSSGHSEAGGVFSELLIVGVQILASFHVIGFLSSIFEYFIFLPQHTYTSTIDRLTFRVHDGRIGSQLLRLIYCALVFSKGKKGLTYDLR